MRWLSSALREPTVTAKPHRKVILFGADGLRPDGVDAALMPNYVKLIAQGTRYSAFYAAFPSQTRVNMTTLATGLWPAHHGVLGNQMLVAGRLIDTAREEDLQEGQTLAPRLADHLRVHGIRHAVVASGSPGAAWLWNPRSPEHILHPTAHYAQAARDALAFDAPRPGSTIGRLEWALDAFFERLSDPTFQVLTLWLHEPDFTQHSAGLGAPETREVLREVDALLGRLLERLTALELEDRVDLLLLSDHGHSSVTPAGSLTEHLARASADLELKGAYQAVDTFIYGPPKADVVEAGRLAMWLSEQPWCAFVFSSLDLPGTLPLDLAWGTPLPPHTPLFVLGVTWSDDCNEYGVPGVTHALSADTALRTTHGSASPYDMRALCVGYGPSFEAGQVDARVCGTADIAPTVWALLGLPFPSPLGAGFDGCALTLPPAAGTYRTLTPAASPDARSVLLWSSSEERYFCGGLPYR